MATIQKCYFHDAASTVAGTLPGSTSQSTSTPTVIATGASTNRLLDDNIGALQTSAPLTTNASTTAQSGWFRRFVSLPLAAQTIAAITQFTCTGSIAGSESNANSNLSFNLIVYIWRPSGGGSLVGRLWDAPAGGAEGGTPGTTETNLLLSSPPSGGSAAVTTQDGDVLVVEIWRHSTAQAMATAYTNTFFYDGTTEGSITSNAAFLGLPVALTLQNIAAAPALSRIKMVGNAAVKRSSSFCLGEKWARKGRLWVPSSDRPFVVGA